MIFNFHIAPRNPQELQTLINSKENWLGIEFTHKGFDFPNIDPQHTDGNTELAAIECLPQAIKAAVNMGEWQLTHEADVLGGQEQEFILPFEINLITSRADLDSIGLMALIKAHFEGENICFGGIEVLEDTLQEYHEEWVDTPLGLRVEYVAKSDKFAHGAWKPKPLPSRENPFVGGSVEDTQQLAVIDEAIKDWEVPIEQRVEWMWIWLSEGTEPEGYKDKVMVEKMSMIEALENGSIKTQQRQGFTFVESTHKAGTTVGYCSSPVVVAFNPKMRRKEGNYEKWTICQYQVGHVNLQPICDALNELETCGGTWGGIGKGEGMTLLASPFGITSSIGKEKILEVIQKLIG